jgi:transcriptional regulator with XRE-family HTH domain
MAKNRYFRWAVADRVRLRREQLGLTQDAVGKLIGYRGGTSMASLEHGSGLDLDKLIPLAAALDCTVSYLLGLTRDPKQWAPDTPLSRWRPPPETKLGPPDSPFAPPPFRRPR